MDRPVNIVEPDPRWPQRFETVAAEIAGLAGLPGKAVLHVGSTAVPGCAGKDLIDVLVSVDGATPAAEVLARVVAPLQAAGYDHRRDHALFMPERWFLHRDVPFAVNVHVERTGLAGAVRDTRLVLRDALRAEPALRDRYVALKRALARTSPDVDTYAQGKSDFVLGVLAEAAERGDHCGAWVRAEHPGSAVATALVEDYAAHLGDHVPGGSDCAADSPPPEGALEPPGGTFLVARDDARPIGCGGVWAMEPGVAEVCRMWVDPRWQGRGIGGRVLEALETAALALDCHTARLHSMHALASAVATYRAHGFREVPDYNGNPNATIWMERPLRARSRG